MAADAVLAGLNPEGVFFTVGQGDKRGIARIAVFALTGDDVVTETGYRGEELLERADVGLTVGGLAQTDGAELVLVNGIYRTDDAGQLGVFKIGITL